MPDFVVVSLFLSEGPSARCNQTLSIFGHDLTSPPIGILIHIAMVELRAPSDSAANWHRCSVRPQSVRLCLRLPRQLPPLISELEPTLFEGAHGGSSHLIAQLGLHAVVLR